MMYYQLFLLKHKDYSPLLIMNQRLSQKFLFDVSVTVESENI